MLLDRVLKLVAGVSFLPLTAYAQPEPSAAHTACSAAYENAQEERSRGHLQSARAELQGCVQAECPEFVQADCSKWLGEIDTAMPSLVFAVRNHGEDLRDVRVSMDGKSLLGELDGSAVVVDPGMHTFEFRVPARKSPIVKKLLVLEGEKNRILVIELSDLPPPVQEQKLLPPEPKSEAFRFPPLPEVLPYALLGVGVLGVAGFSMFGLQGNTREAELEHTCAPNCSDSALQEVRTKWLLADISLGVGIIGIGTGTYLLLSRSHAEKQQSRHALLPKIDVRLSTNGAFSSVKAAF